MRRTEQNRTEQNRTEQNRTEQNRTEQNRTEQNRTEQKVNNFEHEVRNIKSNLGKLQIPSRDLQSSFSNLQNVIKEIPIEL
jgi:uncharacterized phage infection (PIP) family protein YhgE